MKVASFLLMIFMPLCAMAQSASDLFLTMPSRLFPALTEVNKADMIDFINSGMKSEVKNVFDSTVVMTEMNDTYLSVKTSSVGSMQMKVLPLNDSTSVICLVRTVCPGACLSNVRFFSTGWEQLERDTFFTMPALSDFVMRNDSAFMADSVAHSSLADIDLFELYLSPDDYTLTIMSSVTGYTTKEEAARLSQWLKPEGVRLQWRDGKFVIAD